MKYIISTIGKAKNSDEDIITHKYLKRIKNLELKQYEVKDKRPEKKREETWSDIANPKAPADIPSWRCARRSCMQRKKTITSIQMHYSILQRRTYESEHWRVKRHT